MRNLLYILIFLFLSGNIQSQNLYYQYKDRLYINGEEVKIKIDSVEYNIYDGVVSPGGEYICGTLLDDSLQMKLNLRNYQEEIDSPLDPQPQHIIMYSLKKDSLIFNNKIECCHSFIFSNDGKYLLLDGYTSFLFKTEIDIPLKYFSEHFGSFKWFNGDLYFFATIINKCFLAKLNLKNKEVLSHFDITNSDISCVYEISPNIYKGNILGFSILDSSRIIDKQETDEFDYFIIYDRNKKIATFEFAHINKLWSFSNNIFIVGNLKERDKYKNKLYSIDLDSFKIIQLFNLEELKHYTDDLIPYISIFAVTDNEIYFKISILFYFE